VPPDATIVTDPPGTGLVSAPPADSGSPINVKTYYTEAGMDYRALEPGHSTCTSGIGAAPVAA
jgi:hypothetical protein